MDRMCSLQKAAAPDLDAVYALTQDEAAHAACARAFAEGRLHVLRVSGSEEIAGAAALFDAKDEDGRPALLLRAVAVRAGEPGTLHALVESCELIAKLRGKETMIAAGISCCIQDMLLRMVFAKCVSPDGETALCKEIHQGCCCGG